MAITDVKTKGYYKVRLIQSTRTLQHTYLVGDVVLLDKVTALRWLHYQIAELVDQDEDVTADSPTNAELWAKNAQDAGITEEEKKLREMIADAEGEDGLDKALEETEQLKNARAGEGTEVPDATSRAGKAAAAESRMGVPSAADKERARIAKRDAVKAKKEQVKKDAEDKE